MAELPQLCSVCVRAPAQNVVPDRSEHGPPFRFDVMCPLCLDGFCGLFPLRPQTFAAREITGDLRAAARLRGARARA